MAVHHFFTQPENVDDDTIVLDGEEAHHAARVLRVRIGERITIADGNGRVYDASVRSLDGDVSCEIVGVRDVPVPRPIITIHQALVKGDRMDDVIERSVEVGVRRIVPFDAERSVVRWDHAKRDKAHIRWNEIARAASKQSRSPWLTIVEPVQDAPPREGFVLYEEAVVRLRDALPSEPPDEIALVVGPEGSFTAAELEGRCTVSLGERVLRSEFAGPVAATIVSFVYGSLG